MINKLKQQDDSEFKWIDEEGVYHRSKKDYLQQKILGWCGCGDPDTAMDFLKDVLTSINDNTDQIKKITHTEGIYYFVLYALDEKGFTEHGTSVR